MGPQRTRTIHGSTLRMGDSRLRYARRRAAALSVPTRFESRRASLVAPSLPPLPPGLRSLPPSIWCSRSSSTPPDPSRSLIWPLGRSLDSMSSASRALLVGAWVVRHDRFISWIVRRLCDQFVCSMSLYSLVSMRGHSGGLGNDGGR
jgi:hypothetical protein